MSPKVTVVTPTKNRLSLLCETMDSIRAQTFEAWEHIIVDDGSDDGTTEEVRRRAKIDQRIRYVQRTGNKSGANVCRNQGLATASAELIIFLDSDDLLTPDCLARRVAVMERNLDLDFVTFQTDVFKEKPGDLQRQYDADLLGDDLVRFLYFEIPWIITAPIWRKSSLVRLGVFDESLLSWQDVDLHVRAVAAALHYVRFSDVDHYVRWQDTPDRVSIMQRRAPNHLEGAERLLVKFERVVREGPGLTWTRQRALCSLYFFVSERWLEIGQLSNAMACWQQMRRRRLGSASLYATGAGVLLLEAIGVPGRRLGQRIAHKWKGWARLRTNAELVN